MSEWRSVEEALPTINGWYPVVCDGRVGWLQSFYDRSTKSWALNGVTHWVQLDKLPRVK